MSRYFFDVLDGENFFDGQGVVFDSYETMQSAAMRAAGTMISERTTHDQAWTMIIRDEQRRIVATFIFDKI